MFIPSYFRNRKRQKKDVEYISLIETNNIENYFQINNLIYDYYEEYSLLVEENSIFSEYLNFFWNKNDFNGEKLQKSSIKALTSKIAKRYICKLSTDNVFMILKLCAKFGIEVKNWDYLEIKKKKIDPIYYITDEDIIKISSNKKEKIIEIIVKNLFNLDDKYLMKLIKGKIGLEICRCVLNLLNQGYNLNNFINNNKEDFHIFLKLLLSVAQNHKEIQYILNIIKGLIPTLKFIKENIDILLIIESKCFPINLVPPSD